MYALIVFIFLYSCQTFQIENPPPPFTFASSPARVKINSKSHLRDAPNANGNLIDQGILAENYIVIAMKRTDFRDTVNGFEDYWYEVEYRDKIGWVFGKSLDFSEDEIKVVRFLPIIETNPNLNNLKKIKKYYEENFKPLQYEKALELYGKPLDEKKFLLSNHHGSFNRYIEMEYKDFRLKFIDKALFEFSISANEKLNPVSNSITIGTVWKFVEIEFGMPFSISNSVLSYSTCNPTFRESCQGTYPNRVEIKFENQQVNTIVFTRYID